MAQISCEYARQHYGVPAEIGRRVVVNDKPGVIAEDRGHYVEYGDCFASFVDFCRWDADPERSWNAQ